MEKLVCQEVLLVSLMILMGLTFLHLAVLLLRIQARHRYVNGSECCAHQVNTDTVQQLRLRGWCK